MWPSERPLIIGTEMLGEQLEARSGDDRRDEQRGLVADAAGGVLVDGEGVERRGVEGLAGEAHGAGQVGGLAQARGRAGRRP